MKKKIFLFLTAFIIFLTGCELSNNPNSKVEELLGNYQRLDNTINITYTDLTDETNLTDEQKERYTKLIEDQYEDMSYEIKEEEIDGNSATVTAQIKVFDYKEIINKYNKGNHDINEYHKTIIKDLEKQKDKIVYTIEFKLNKTDNDKWGLTALQIDDQKKLLGIN